MPSDPDEFIDAAKQDRPQSIVTWSMLLWLAALEWLTFGKGMGAGFYLDDWTMLHSLHFAPSGLVAATQFYFLHDPRVTMRPLEALHFALLYRFFGENPLGYHIAYAAFEVLALWVFFLILRNIFASKSAAFLAATLALLDPRHDTTHYWVMCNSVSLSLCLSLFSILLSDLGAKSKKAWLHLSAIFCFCLSILNYELFLPFLLLNAAVSARHEEKQKQLKAFLQTTAIFAAPVGLLLLYQKLIVPMLVTPFVHGIILDPAEIVSTIFDGLSLQTIPGCVPLALTYFPLNWPEIGKSKFLLALPAMATTFLFVKMERKEERQGHSGKLLEMSTWGLATIVIGYSIFGLNKEYHPAIETIFNRVNTGPGLGTSMIFAGLATALLRQASNKARIIPKAIVVALTMIILTTYSILDHIFQKPWMAAKLVQTHIRSIIKKNAQHLKPGDSVLLANCPRYVNWTPVFDGVWDFERMLQITIGSNKIAGGVVSERLKIQESVMKDISMGYLCESYRFPEVFVLLPDQETLTSTPTASAFIQLIETRGQKFSSFPDAIKGWKESIGTSNPPNSPHE